MLLRARIPPTVIFSGGLEPLRDENFASVARLKNAGMPVKHTHVPGEGAGISDARKSGVAASNTGLSGYR